MKFAAFAIAAAAAATSLLAASAALADRAVRFEPYAGAPDEGAVILPMRGEGLEGPAAEIDRRTGGALARAIAAAGYTGEKGATLTLFALGPYDRMDLVGLGEEDEDLGRLALEDFGAHAAAAVEDAEAETVTLLWPHGPAENAAHIRFGMTLGQYEFIKYKSDDDGEDAVEAPSYLIIATPDADGARAAWENDWAHLADAIVMARNLQTEPANVIYPESFVAHYREAFRGLRNVRITVLDVDDMERLGMGALLGVGQGSVRPPRLMAISYSGGARGEAPVVFAGKGITFDSGGLSLKTGAGMREMKADMTGAAVVSSTVLALAKRGARVNAVAIAALAENMPDGGAQRVSDVVRAMSGKTIEIISTDAEGRLVLADAVTYAQEEFDPKILVDIATLTGSVRTALADEYAGLFSRHDQLAEQLIAAGRVSGEEVWRLPLHPNYKKQIKSPIADIKNSGAGNPGAGIGATVIGAFVDEDTVWAHLDIAGMDHRTDALPTVPEGYTAYGVRLLDQLVRDYYEAQ